MLIATVDEEKADAETAEMSRAGRRLDQAVGVEDGQHQLQKTLQLWRSTTETCQFDAQRGQTITTTTTTTLPATINTHQGENSGQVAALLQIDEEGVGQDGTTLPPLELHLARAGQRARPGGGDRGGRTGRAERLHGRGHGVGGGGHTLEDYNRRLQMFRREWRQQSLRSIWLRSWFKASRQNCRFEKIKIGIAEEPGYR